jgi:hypothetical protein
MRGADQNQVRERELFPIIYGVGFPPQKVDKNLMASKRQKISIISSLAQDLPGHRQRNRLISQLLEKYEPLRDHTYGRGRTQELESKLDGLLEYQFSLAIENSRQSSYISEKFTDCILAGTIPVYLGALNVASFFPAGSFVSLNSVEFQEIDEKLESLTSDFYLSRVPAIEAAQHLLATQYNLIGLIESVLSEAPGHSKPRWVLLYGLDSVLAGLNALVSRFILSLPLSIRLLLRKVLARIVFGRLHREANW